MIFQCSKEVLNGLQFFLLLLFSFLICLVWFVGYLNGEFKVVRVIRQFVFLFLSFLPIPPPPRPPKGKRYRRKGRKERVTLHRLTCKYTKVFISRGRWWWCWWWWRVSMTRMFFWWPFQGRPSRRLGYGTRSTRRYN